MVGPNETRGALVEQVKAAVGRGGGRAVVSTCMRSLCEPVEAAARVELEHRADCNQSPSEAIRGPQSPSDLLM